MGSSMVKARDVSSERAAIDEAVRGATLCTALAATVKHHPDVDALSWRSGDGWATLTWHEYAETVGHVARALRAFGLAPGETVALQARNRPEHVLADAAVLHAGGVPVSLYNTAPPDQLRHVITNSGATMAVVEADLLAPLQSIRAQLPFLRLVVVVGDTTAGGDVSWEAVVRRGARAGADRASDRRGHEIAPDEGAALVYTSGTTGPAKGVVHTHRTVLWTLESIARRARLGVGDRLVSYLPLAHSAERWFSHWRGMVDGASTYFCSDPALLVATLRAVRPTWFVGVPRTWEKLAGGIQASIEADRDDRRRAAILEALEVARRVVDIELENLPMPGELSARRARGQPVLTSLLGAVGLDQCRVAISGAAPISTDVLAFFHALGLRVSEGWGMTELMAGAWNGTERIKIGTVGPTLPGVEARIAPDRELLARGGGTMVGYHADPVATMRAVGADGWLRTGDIADIDGEGYIRIVDRKKDLIITAGGTKVSPANVEQLLKEHPLVGQVCVVGERRPFLSVLVVLDAEAVGRWSAALGLGDVRPAELGSRPEVLAEVQRAVDAANRRLARPEQIKKFAVIAEEWNVDRGELTPTLKVRRDVVCAKHADLIEAMYG